ncbi:LTA synthase family protein [Rhodanobacter sp. C01]|uniref:LTA synthase family protein n=1 Tax=Rhodanobacter sp. C01 TaxID=1945856 RepID=UPI0020C326B9|nr:LTA synthase family protein [Rhodanobacter sp. C01]
MSRAFTRVSPLRQRFRPLWWLAITFVLISFVTRVALLVMSGQEIPHTPLNLLYAFGVGLGYDLVTFIYVAWPMVLMLWLVPARRAVISGPGLWLLYLVGMALLYAACLGLVFLLWHVHVHESWPLIVLFLFFLPMPALAYSARSGQWAMYVMGLVLLYGLFFVAASELVFWNEFSVRFNFIAVDYLVYTTEVIGNIQESYPIGRWMGLLMVAALVVFVLTKRGLRTRDEGSRFWQRSKLALVWLVLTVLSLFAVNSGMKDRTGNSYVDELAGNGIYQFFAAFRSSHLDYAKFYQTLPEDRAFAILRDNLKAPNASFVSDDPKDLTRAITHVGPEKHLNVVLISVESLSGDYLGTFGNKENLTPYLDSLVSQSVFFDNMYANGTRTVRGLEALSLSVPPTPGDSLIREHNNENLFSIADIFNDRGYQSDFVYGGYGYFDNMNYFFSHNGYKTVDRGDIPKDAVIHSQNVWGVSDEDLYTLALKQMDDAQAAGKPFFLHIMTTSNHRPYTYPAGRVSQIAPSRPGAVAYTDWSIKDFIQRARSKPYFDNTVFVITADHCASSAGKTAIPINHYHIPLWIYSPKNFPPQRVHTLMGQLDIPPTLLGMLNFSYRTRFFGQDVFQLPTGGGHALPGTYEKLGYLRDNVLTVLEPRRKLEQFTPDYTTGDATPIQPVNQAMVDQAIAYYQVSSDLFKRGQLVRRPSDATPVQPLPLPAPAASVPASATSAPAPRGSTAAPATAGTAAIAH